MSVMSYKTILVHLDRKDILKNRVRIAANLAKANDGHLLGIATIGIAATQSSYFYSPQDLAFAEHMKYLRYKAGQFVEEFKEEVKITGLEAYEGRVVGGDASSGISLLGRVSDLIVIGRTNLDDASGASVTPDFPEFVMMNSGRPVLIIPPDYPKETVGSKIMICWNASRESIRAVADALPLLAQAELVQIIMFNVNDEVDMDATAAGSDIAVYLKRHGVKVEVLPPQQSRDIGKSLLVLAEEQEIDLLVMGGYGHTRFREFLLGGVTRTVLESSKVPVLMSH